MSAVLLGTFEVESPPWHAARANGLGGSEIASVVGLSPWVSPYALWCRKRGEIGPQEVNTGMDWGKRLEPVVMDAFTEYFPNLIVGSAGTYCHADRPWQIANPDALTADEIPVDAKTADKNDAWKWGPNGSDQVPAYYRCQMVWYGDVFNTREGYIACLIGGNDFRTYHLAWDEREAAWLRWQGRQFWRSVVEGVRPAIDDTNSTYEAIRELHPDIQMGLEAEVDPEAWAAWSQAADEIKRLEAVVTHAKSVIADEIEDARYGTFGGERVVIRQSNQGGHPYVKAIPRRDT